MNNDKYFDETRLREALTIMKPNDQLFEIRMIKGRQNMSGYFKNADTLINALNKVNMKGFSMFITLNTINDACYGRQQRDQFVDKPQNTTSDNEIENYDWLLIDLDPERITGISSTNEELEKARRLAEKIASYLKAEGWNDPIIAMSGNGYHLLYSIGLKNTPENIELVQKTLQALDLMFSTDDVHVDTGNFNPSRICKMYGALAQKGTGTEDRPHRISYIVQHPDAIKQNRRAYLEKLAAVLPEVPKPEKYNHYNPGSFDVVSWMNAHSIRYEEKSGKGYKRYLLDECPFNPNHKSPDSMITVGDSGAIGFKCLHNSCQGKTWQDVRKKYEPDAYERNDDDRRISEGWATHKKFNRNQMPPVDDDPEEVAFLEDVPEDEHPGFITAREILDKKPEPEFFIETGISMIDQRLRGLKKGYITLISGLRGSGKSTLLSQIILSAVNNSYNVLCVSGEQKDTNFLEWMMLQAAGKTKTIESKKWPGYYFVPSEIKLQIADWLGGRFLLYDNNFGFKYDALMELVKKNVEKQKTDLIILDNLMMLDIRSLNANDKYDAQSEFVRNLSIFALQTNTHIIFVAHPRKAQGFLRLEDVSGSNDLLNKTDYAFIVHRNNNDFKIRSAEMFHFKTDNPIYSGTNVIEIAKDRDHGTQDVFVPLFYEQESKRLKNSQTEAFEYGWNADDNGFVQVPIRPDEDIPF